MRIVLVAGVIVFSALNCGAAPVVNEIMADNKATLADPEGEFDDWVEIYNPDTTDLDLRGYFVSDDVGDRSKWVIAGEIPVVVPAGGYAILWLDNDPEQGADHLPFRLKSEGDTFILTSPDGSTVVDQVALPLQHPDISFGRSSEHGGEFRYLINPTPGMQNDPIGVASLDGINFSRGSGTFVEAFQLVLQAASEGAEIRYTTDGKTPDAAAGLVYSSPVEISETTCFRAALFIGARAISPVETRVFMALDGGFAGFTSNLPIVLLDSQGYDFSSDSTPSTDYPARPVCAGFFQVSEVGRAAVSDSPQFSGRAGMNVRGASSKAWPKKQFKFETWNEEDGDRDVSLLGMPSDSDWILSAPYFDKSLMRNEFVYHWWGQLGYYSPRTRYVEVFLNPDPSQSFSMDHYRGVYLLTEKIKRSSDRMDVTRLEPGDVGEPAVSGGYIAQATNLNEDWTSRRQGTRYKYVEPSSEDGVRAQQSWLQRFVESAETSVYAGDFDDPISGYARYLDVPSQVDYDIMRELSRNADGASTFFSIDRGGKLKMGPLWDYNQALGLTSLGNSTLGNSWETEGWNRYYMQAGHWLAWWDKLDDDPAYQMAWNDRWVELRESVFTTESLLGHIDSVAARLDEAQVRNFAKWDILGDAVWSPNGKTRADPGESERDTYAKEVAFLRNWVGGRIQWIDSQVPSPPDFSSAGGSVGQGFSLSMDEGAAYQPFQGEIYYTVDGSDPSSSESAVIYNAPIILNESISLLARTQGEDGSWSAIRGALFIVGAQDPTSAALTISEVHYNPDGPDDLEFIEITNRSAVNVDLTGVRLAEAVDFEFGESELKSGGIVVVVEDEAAFRAAFSSADSPDYVPDIVIAGQWSGRLNNAGEAVALLDAEGAVIHSLAYGADGDWPEGADGKGFSLEVGEISSDPNDVSSWRLSSFENGSPGRAPSAATMTAEQWRELNFTAGELARPEVSDLASDPDNDGLSNLLEFGLVTLPQEKNGPPFVVATETVETEGDPQTFLTLTFNRPVDSELQYALQVSSNLGEWEERPLIRVRSSVEGGLRQSQ